MQNSAQTMPLLDTILTALVPVIWGTTYWVTTEMLPDARPMTTAVIRCLPAGLVLVGISRSWRPPVSWTRTFLLALLNISALQTFLFIAAYRLPGGMAALTSALQPMIVLGLVWLIEHQRPSRPQYIICGIGFLGMLLLLGRPSQSSWDFLGLCAAFGTTISMAVGVVLTRRWNPQSQLLGFTGWQLLIGGILILPLALILEPSLDKLTFTHYAGYLYLCLIGTMVAYALWFRGIERITPVAVSSLALLSPITALLIGWIFLDQHLSTTACMGALLVLLSVTALQWQLSRKSRPDRTTCGPSISSNDKIEIINSKSPCTP